ncbi:MAG: hypothetical protein R6W86_16610 [Marinobacter sp.]|uniref:hypothetical protein n=1 Tax=Marinobacter sp. TaxID=50741 RepID=UPI00396E461E
MNTFLQIAFGFPTLLWTALLLFSLLYWVVAIVGIADFDVFDIDLDLTEAAGSGLAGLMATLGLTGVPLPLVLTAFSLSGWMVSYFGDLLLLTNLSPGLLSLIAGTLLFIVSLVTGTKLGALLIKPVKGLFKSTKACRRDVLGITGTAVYAISGDAGQIDCFVNGAHVRLQARSNQSIQPGEKAVVIKYHRELKAYQVIPEADFITGVTR